MERLTKSDLNKVCYDPWELCGMDGHCTKGCHEEGGCAKGCHILKMYKKLADYEDAEEQGLLIRLPCKIGDTVYRICPKCSDIHDGSCEGCAWYGAIFKNGCNIYGYDSSNGLKFQIIPYKVSWEYIPNLIENIGENVFLTYEEAEMKLKEMEGKSND